jgi:hypothetical protein
MKKLLLLLFSLLLSFNSYGEWTKVAENDDGDYYFVDFDKVKYVDGNVYWWMMYDAVESYYYVDEDEPYFSEQSYNQGDCQINRFKVLSTSYYSKPMGEDLIFNWNEPEPQWDYFPPESIGEYEFELVCSLVDKLENSKVAKHKQIIEDFKISVEYTSIINRKSKVAKVENEELLIIDDQKTILRDAYLSNVSARVKSLWRFQGAETGWEAEVYVVQDRDGQVLAVDVRTFNIPDRGKAKIFRDSIERAVYKSSPLPPAPDDSVFDKELVFLFTAD